MDWRPKESAGWTRPMPGYGGHRPFAWSRTDDTFRGPHEKRPSQAFELHIEGYSGHRPRAWVPPSQKMADGSTSSATTNPTPFKAAGLSSFRRSFNAPQGYAGHRPRGWSQKPPSSSSAEPSQA
eukprot:TRINITY_DN114886_c0_g1_i1.p1 TRINITY_DN114886_c0_g1~~TRINITY_DN114886_c0_g1_i1.p1  ORF type:complete len:124 (+),score=11.61 TRINITY_DN114886_c0_g1_i1:122-493(+)